MKNELLNQNPQPLDCQLLFKDLSDKILKFKPTTPLSLFTFRVKTNPYEVLARLQQSSLNDLLLQDGESFSVNDPDERFPDVGVIMGKTPLTQISITHWDWQDAKWRRVPNQPEDKIPYDIIEYPGEYDWRRKINLNFIYQGDTQIASAYQSLIISDASLSTGIIPRIGRFVYVPQYAETGYEGHNRKYRSFKDEKEASFFIHLLRELFEKSLK